MNEVFVFCFLFTNTSLSLFSSTGRASNLTSPTADFSPDTSSASSKPFPAPSSSDTKTDDVDGVSAPPEKIKHSSSSIIGLRAATFDSGSKSKTEEVTEDKPRPPPKPRPWSIVGVDRKSGEYTQVEASGAVTPPPEPEVSEETEAEDGGDNKAGDTGRRGSAANRGGSVRDMIANLNKPEKETSGTVGGLLGGQSVRDRIASMNNQGSDVKKKGNSLPRTGVAEAINPAAAAKSPGVKAKASPHNFRKESTTDDPRIMKLDDDFMYDDSVNV